MSALLTPVARPGLTIIKDGWVPEHLRPQFKTWSPKTGLSFAILRLLRDLERQGVLPDPDAIGEILEHIWRTVVISSELRVQVFRHPDSPHRIGDYLVEDYGVVSRKLVTDAGVAFVVDAFQNSVELENMKFHGIGTATTAESAAQTALTTEITTAYNPDNTRATGSTTEHAANIYKTIGLNTVDGAATIEEHGVFTQAATGGGTMLDRSLTGTQTLSSGDGLNSDYRLTLTSGG